ncbi:NodT family efflux transporter outer membrane factor (OMF) lipoprotein [Pseudoduganella flava]|uniref:Efflux transporter outer membrane subunit n=1 Tax=Pseudoduganella flava TaxID=871742 RepID=A0A562Q390_9BURK|nr:efflux transporter outer membrane subunit [Pseudoduganella flava]QGZ41250.1 efflux transporter outer membrane subunit [Pseudoduganella flava]TWI51187.1 NodT family efflux transporter outer membrane factor (OMF) lipoprotein [Pseudoduganella flava]
MKTLPLAPPFVLCCALLAACTAVGPDHHIPATAVPAGWQDWHGGAPELRATALSAAGTQAYARFDDPVLRGLLRRALDANADLRTAELRFAQSRVQRAVAAAGNGPRVDAQAGATRQRQSETGTATRMLDALAPRENRAALIDVLAAPFDVYQAGFDASWEPDLWGRVRRSIEAADADAAQAQALLRDASLTVAVEVARNYHELRAARLQLRLAREDVTAAEELLQLAQARSHGGLGTDLDVVRQQALVAELRGALPGLQEQEAQAENRLSLLLGVAPGALHAELAVPSDADTPGAVLDLALGIPADLLTRRPDIAAAEAALHAATARIGIARADLYPRIVLGASFGTESTAGGRFGEWGSRQWSIGPTLSLPLFDRGVRRATVQLRELDQQQAAVAWQHTVLRAWHEVDDALSAYAAEWQRHEQWRQREDAARTALELAMVRWRGGLSDALPLLDAQRTMLAARRARVQSEAALTLRLLAICKATAVMPEA